MKNFFSIIGFIAVVYILIAFLSAKQDGAVFVSTKQGAAPIVASAHEQIAKDAMEKAIIATKAKDYSGACGYLGLAASATLDAKNEKQYRQILKLKKNACKRQFSDEE